MNDCKGYTLIEVLVALVCLSIMTAALFPAFVWFMNESADVKRVKVAQFLLEDAYHEYLSIHELRTETIVGETVYQFNLKESELGAVQLCIHWVNRKGQAYETCRLAKL
ncbi:type II secretion system protein [Halalkalibacterium halodurans]|jgi:competence protein ComGE|uniref:BH2825 protein n=2 Tax=Halalkalibacterium halodurans TaxID=86665 RepID=Q9K925_HALH5|nr:type II secretion system protein [Halalkalibacterium halodurans]MDY7223378.1 type II secretion system protein [Halalkalibacterium halodurans]MDY7242599.1 type II secretion system protein [Halalkalibacterium halodurans]MED3647289.1 type II secretion system protein [Halalkalibacterium halodurans]MED4081694.1 type II secretion system protein [Halalkalibacterium halodurans]MED4085247.1 type II secretion system protein [Halalkalibacterium halodurans]